MTAQWEYKMLTYKVGWKGLDYDQIEQDLNELGQQGWEALGSIAPSVGSGQTMEIVVILKKPYAQPAESGAYTKVREIDEK